jgi:hypothetical protein
MTTLSIKAEAYTCVSGSETRFDIVHEEINSLINLAPRLTQGPKFFLFVCGLFNDAVSSTHSVASNDGMINEYR